MTSVPNITHLPFMLSPEMPLAGRVIALLVEAFEGNAVKQMRNVIALKLDDSFSITLTLGPAATTAAIVSESKVAPNEDLVITPLRKSMLRMALRNDSWDDFVGWVSLAKKVYESDLRCKLLAVNRAWQGLSPGGLYEVEKNPLYLRMKLRRFDLRPAEGESPWIEVAESALLAALDDGTVKYHVRTIPDEME